MHELLEAVPAAELTEWAAFYQLEPFGEYRGDLRAGVVASTVANVHAKKGHSFTPADFMPKFQPDPPKPTMTADDAMAALKRIAGAFNG